jgi:hypothetical protein
MPLQMSEAVAPPRAALITVAVGLHPIEVELVDVGTTSGGLTSIFQVTVRDAVPILPALSVAVHVRVCEPVQPVDPTGPSDAVGTGGPLQLSETITPPSAVFIVAVLGLHPRNVDPVEVGVRTGGVISADHVTILKFDEKLLQPSCTTQNLNSDPLQPLIVMKSLAEGVRAPAQLSEAVAPPKALSIIADVGLPPRKLGPVNIGVITG